MKKCFIALGALLLLVTSCATNGPSNKNSTNISVGSSAKTLQDEVAMVQTSLQDVKTPLSESGQHIDNAKITVLTTNNPSAVVAELDSAKLSLEKGKDLVDKANVSVMTALNTATQTVAAAQMSEKTIKDLTADRDRYKAKADSQSAWVFKLLLATAAGLIVAGIGICVASMLIGFASIRAGAFVIAGGVALLVLTLTLQHYERQIIIGCGIFLLIVFAYFCWKLFASAKANKELVEFGEALKTKAPPDFKHQLFGDSDAPHPHSIADSIQSDSTQKIVRQIRQHLEISKIKKK